MNYVSLLVALLLTTTINPIFATSKKGQKVILVLGGGGSKGLAHVGVIEELEKLEIVPDIIVGCSSGAIVGALYAQHRNIAKVKEILIHLTQNDLVDFSLFQKGALSSRDKLEKFLRKHLIVEDFSSLQIPFIAVATDLHKGEPVYFQEGKLLPAVLASTALPVLFPPYKIGDNLYIDGGACDPLPVQFAHSLEEDAVVIASDISSSLNGFDAESLPQIVRKSFEVIYQRLAYSSRKQADVLLMMNFEGINSPIADKANYKLYERGKESVHNQFEALKQMNLAE